MTKTNPTAHSAFPSTTLDGDGMKQYAPGISMVMYAAIHLRVPQSGTPWLDAMITEARRMDNESIVADVGVIEKAVREKAASTSQAEPASEWPKMPDWLPKLPDGYVYVGKGAHTAGMIVRFVLLKSATATWTKPFMSNMSGCARIHYAVHASDLHKVKRGGA